MSDWQVGDLAVCVEAGDELRTGATYTVSAVGVGPATGDLMLDVAGIPNAYAGYCPCFYATRFRKIRPDEHEACEEEFKILLKLSKKRVAA